MNDELRIPGRDEALTADVIEWDGTRRSLSPRPQPVPTSAADTFAISEAGDSEFFAQIQNGRLLFDHTRRRWFQFGPHHWRLDTTERVLQAALDAMRRRQALALTVTDSDERKRRLKWAVAGESEARLHHLLELAATHPTLATEGADWDRDPWLLGVQNGIVDLRTGMLRPGVPDDHVTLVAAVAYERAALCARWDRFVLEICDGHVALAVFLQRSIGYALTGLTTEQCFWIWYGVGGNGKTTFLETITQHILPEHSWTMSFPVHTWTESISEYQRAELAGRRLVVAKESEQAKRLNTEFVKSLTGGDTVNARHPYGRPFRFVPPAKFFLACNHKPIIRDETHGMWRRVRLVPFVRIFPLDPHLADILASEAEGILRWCVAGCVAWQSKGLALPTKVAAATEDYRAESDTLLQFFTARCVLADYARIQAAALWIAYDQWCQTERIHDDERLGRRTFVERMRREFHTLDGQRVTYVGIGLAEEKP